MQKDPTTQFLKGPAGRLEALLTQPTGITTAFTLICHPHPLFGGTMHNKVVTTLAKAFDAVGFATLRFNYRGVGQSEGQYGNFIGETEDLLAIIDWVKSNFPNIPIWLAGFSFGGFIAANAANQDQTIQQLITIAPAVNHIDFSSLTNIACPWTLIQGEQDEIVPFNLVKDFVAHSLLPIQFITLPNCGHFFHGCLLALTRIVQENVT